ncbi:SDR family NAD(P)-dependent oxidoreductase [Sphingobium sp. EP60837]|uniref:SDR family NAD(P)-dependent oxidoreductase n=1 Tax=Sphingobium sp. EP60837 TaxID=1855519 RepID=UPI0007DD98BE|nr:SDR family NAD(P)-dependent oxidoreductase [Sphingobium sp. EP60837]ANI80225.1 hypothetical protein EP837_03847 [Sphingobium sp. EP60837]
MAQSFDVAQKAAVVTGGASGIGKGIAAALKQAGARVMIADIEVESLARTQAELGVEASLLMSATPRASRRSRVRQCRLSAMFTSCATMPAWVRLRRWQISGSKIGVG